MYSQKTIQNLKPGWYLNLSRKEKLAEQERLKKERAKMWSNKPEALRIGTKIIAKRTTKSITQGKTYTIRGYFATLVTTIYYSEWHEFVIMKNNSGWTVKMNLKNFNIF